MRALSPSSSTRFELCLRAESLRRLQAVEVGALLPSELLPLELLR